MHIALVIVGLIFCVSGMNLLIPDDDLPFVPYWERAVIFMVLFPLGLTGIYFGVTP